MKKVFAALAGKVRRMTAPFRERPTMKVDDHVMEHFLLYNGLIGSTPENQRDYKDVRNDIVQAVNDRSAHLLAIALKLPPLWWEDRLEKIFGEIQKINREGAVACLMATRPIDDTVGDTTPLSHTDWRVRSNAAKMLAFLDAKEAVPRLVEILPESSKEHPAAFCHLAHSLGTFGTDQARQALIGEIGNDEHWFRVDVAASLAKWNLAAVAPDLMKLLLDGCDFDDYMAVAIARHHKPSSFAEFHDDEIHEGLAEMTLALIKAINGPFHAEHSLIERLEEISPKINELAHVKPSSRRIAAAIAVNKFVEERSSAEKAAGARIKDLSNASHYEAVRKTILNADVSTPTQISELKHALALATQFKLPELSPSLIPLLDSDFPLLPDLVVCLGSLSDVNSAEKIVQLVESKINLAGRQQQSFSAHPVVESNKEDADFYWAAIKALGSLPHPSSLRLLNQAVNDFAPDKREQALLSLQNILLSEDLRKQHYTGDFEALLKERILDPAISVQVAALKGVAQHKLNSLLPEVLRALHSRDTQVQRRAAETLHNLAMNGHKDEIKSACEAALSKETDSAKKQRLERVLERLN